MHEDAWTTPGLLSSRLLQILIECILCFSRCLFHLSQDSAIPKAPMAMYIPILAASTTVHKGLHTPEVSHKGQDQSFTL